MMMGAEDDKRLDTNYSSEMVEALRPCKPGKWLQDELARADKIMARELSVVERYIDVRGCRLLDFGCGAGASSVVWGRMGAVVTGVEPDAQLAAAEKIYFLLVSSLSAAYFPYSYLAVAKGSCQWRFLSENSSRRSMRSIAW